MWFINSDWLIFCEVIIHYKQKFCRLVVISLALLVFYYGWVFHMWNIDTFVLLLMRLLQPLVHQYIRQSPDVDTWRWTMSMSEKTINWTGFCCQCILTCVCQLSFYLSSDVYMAMFEWTRYNYAFLYTMYVHTLKRCFIIINIFFVWIPSFCHYGWL